MTQGQNEDSKIGSIIHQLSEEGFEGLMPAIEILMNAAMKLERSRHLGAMAYERSETREGYANGYKPKKLQTRMGALELSVPQVRDGSFYPSSLDKGVRSERALKVALAEYSFRYRRTRINHGFRGIFCVRLTFSPGLVTYRKYAPPPGCGRART